MRHGSLFSGIGGFELAAEWMGWENVFHCEWMPFPRQVLHHYWPNAISYEDITKTDFTIHRGEIDILTGGFPCQPYSGAGKRLGKADERHLWPEMLRAIREIQPRWIVGENVFGIINWNDGLVFDEVQIDLEAEGYEVQPFVLPASAINAPHRRERVWFIAYSNSNGQQQCNDKYEIKSDKRWVDAFDDIDENDGQRNASDTLHERLERSTGEGKRWNNIRFTRGNQQTGWENFPTQPPICSGDDGLPKHLDGITFPKWRTESLKGYGNAVVPQLVLQIFKTIQTYEQNSNARISG